MARVSATARVSEKARAKINLTLRILGRRADGYHELESLVAFAAVGDLITLDTSGDLLARRALRMFARRFVGAERAGRGTVGVREPIEQRLHEIEVRLKRSG